MASSVTVALNLVVVSSGTETVMPASRPAAVVVAIGVPVQPAVVKRLTADPAGAVPTIFGEFWFAGEAGIVSVSCGGGGAEVSSVKPWVSVAELLAGSVARTLKV
jgi:hypothetical protein